MKGFNYAYSLAGHKTPTVKKYVVPNATVIERGEPINFTVGTGVIVLAAPAVLDDPITAISINEKAANDGQVELEAIPVEGAVFKHKCSHVYTLTGGSTTTAVDDSLVPATNNLWKGGAIKIVSCAADSSLNGRIVKISASTGAGGTLTLAETLPATLATGDTINLCPGIYAHEHLGYDLTSDSMEIDFDADGGNVLRIHDTNPDTMDVFVRFEKHANVS